MTFERKEIEGQLRRILSSERMAASSRQQVLLEYIVEKALQGDTDDLKGYSIALDVFDRPADFDPQSDPLVRVIAGRLRKTLESYYANEGVNDPIRISVPKGGYKPVFQINSGNDAEPADAEDNQPGVSPKIGKSKPVAVILGLVFCIAVITAVVFYAVRSSGNTNGVDASQSDSKAIVVTVRSTPPDSYNDDEKKLSTNFVQMLRAAVSRNQALLVVSPGLITNDPATRSLEAKFNEGLNFAVNGFASKTEQGQRLSVELINRLNKAIIWSRTYDMDSGKEGSIQTEAVDQIARELHSQLLGASKKALAGRDPESLSAAQLFVMATWAPGPAMNTVDWEQERVDLARLALRKNPDFGPAHSVLADKLAFLANMDADSNTQTAIAESKASAARALELSPGDANTAFNVAQAYWHAGQMRASARMMTHVLDLDPNHGLARSLSDVIPYSCAAAPDAVLDAAIAYDKSLAADNPIRWSTLTWLGILHLNRGEFRLALEAENRAAQIFDIPYSFMRRAAILNQMGRIDAAAEVIAGQQRNWPNIDPAHFSEVTIPRICHEQSGADRLTGYYDDLSDAMASRF